MFGIVGNGWQDEDPRCTGIQKGIIFVVYVHFHQAYVVQDQLVIGIGNQVCLDLCMIDQYSTCFFFFFIFIFIPIQKELVTCPQKVTTI